MPLDFRMKHEGEPPARLIAQLRLRLKEANHPPMLAEILAPLMESEDELDQEVMNQITALVNVLETNKVPGAEAMAAIREVVDELIAASDAEGEDDEDFAAFYKNKVAKKPNLGRL